jgi:glutathione S-transferase
MLRWAMGTKVGLHGLDRLSGLLGRLHADADVHAALVIEEGLSARTAVANGRRQLPVLNGRRGGAESLHFLAEVTGRVEYREGEGVLLELRRGLVEVDLSAMDAIVTWADENFRGRAALPAADLYRYADSGAISLVD